MPFIAQGKINWKFLLIVFVLAVIFAGFCWWGLTHIFFEPWDVEEMLINARQIKEKGCLGSGGTISTASCCKSSGDFPDSCLIGACGCSPTDSHEVKTCNCGEGKCFDGEKCVGATQIEEFCGASTYGICNTDSDCMATGCSGQVCWSKNEEGIVTTCEWKECYRAQDHGLSCKCVAKKCQWAK